MVFADCANAVLIGSVPVAGAFHHLTASHVLVVAAASGVATVYFDAADFAALPLLVGSDRLTTATSALYGPHTVIGIIAPGIAALLFKVLSVPSVLALDALSFVASALLLRALQTALTGARGATAPVSTWRDTAFSASGGGIVGQFAPIASALLGRGQEKSGTSLEFLAWGAGGFLASVTLPWLSKRLTGPWIALAGTPVATVLLVLCAVVWRFPWAARAAAVLGAGLWRGGHQQHHLSPVANSGAAAESGQRERPGTRLGSGRRRGSADRRCARGRAGCAVGGTGGGGLRRTVRGDLLAVPAAPGSGVRHLALDGLEC